MGYNHECNSPFLIDFLDHFMHCLTGMRIEVAGWFVGQDHIRIQHEGAGHGNSLLFAA